MIEFLIFGPLLGSVIAGLMYRSIGENAATILATSIVVLGALISWVVFLDIITIILTLCYVLSCAKVQRTSGEVDRE